jgi:hypothetical protein
MTADPVVPDKIRLLMEEASCDRAEAELAMSLAGFDLEKAIRTIGTLLRHIVVVKGKFVDATQNLYGLLILIADTRRDQFIRARAVVSYNPALFETTLGQHWYEFEKDIYAARLAEGALQQVSQDLERSFLEDLGSRRDEFFPALKSPSGTNLAAVLDGAVRKSFPRGLTSQYVPEVIDWNQFRRFPFKGEERSAVSSEGVPSGSGAEEALRIQMEVRDDPDGRPLKEVRVGDHVAVVLADNRDIAHYIAKLFGLLNESGPRPMDVPVETVQRHEGRVRLHVRLSAGILGFAEAPETLCVRVRPRETDPWWRRMLQRESSP